jgi:hypothetical protein
MLQKTDSTCHSLQIKDTADAMQWSSPAVSEFQNNFFL